MTRNNKSDEDPLPRRKVAVIMGDPNKSDSVKPNNEFDEDDFYTINELKLALEKLVDYDFVYFDDHDTLLNYLPRIKNMDFVFNLCDNGFNNNPRHELHVPALLDIFGIPYTGAGPQCLAFCYDKSLVRGIAKEMSIPVPDSYSLNSKKIKFPVIAKPNLGDNSMGITKDSIIKERDEISYAIRNIRESFDYYDKILMEEFLEGKDLTIGIIGNPLYNDISFVLVAEDDYSDLPVGLPRLCGYEAKWEPYSPYSNIKTKVAEIPHITRQIITNFSIRMFDRLGFKDYGRFDWRLDNYGNPKLLEANPNPGWCWDGHMAKMATFLDIPYHKMLDLILKSAEKRFEANKRNGKIRFIEDLAVKY